MKIQIFKLLLSMGLVKVCSCKRSKPFTSKDTGLTSLSTMLFCRDFAEPNDTMEQITMQQKENTTWEHRKHQEQKKYEYKLSYCVKKHHKTL